MATRADKTHRQVTAAKRGETCCTPEAASSAGAVCCTRTRPEALARLAQVAKALADPIRLGMLDVMTQGRGCCGVIDPQQAGVPGAGEPDGICVCEFQEQFGLGQSKASYHLRVLKDAGLVTEETRGKWSFYAVDAERVSEALCDFNDVFGLDEGCGSAGSSR
jgi:ArsR family transcriptional regulator, arsenate/arsenite/antimonite-responsive transcriptional repressor